MHSKYYRRDQGIFKLIKQILQILKEVEEKASVRGETSCTQNLLSNDLIIT